MLFIFSQIKSKNRNLQTTDSFILILIIMSTIFITIPEFMYLKDIYPTYYRANTMFKLVYQAFILLSISSGYIIVRLFSWKNLRLKLIILVIGTFGLFLVAIYPYFAIPSYYGNLKTYYGLNGISYLNHLYPDDLKLITWINKNITGQPVILEAQGDSYTDFARISSNTGLPTVLGWTVHEWLWRGTYSVPAPRITDVTTLYETTDIKTEKYLLKKYNIVYVVVGNLERQKYIGLNENNFKKLGNIVYQYGQTKLYKINSKEL